MKKINKTLILVSFILCFLTVINPNNSLAQADSSGCKISDDNIFFDLLSYEVERFVPSVDENGNTYLQGAELRHAKTNHYRKAYMKAPEVRMMYDRYASLTANDPEALENVESRVLVIDAECNPIRLFYGNLIGSSKVTLSSFFKMLETAKNLKHEKLLTYVEERVSLRPKEANDIFEMLRSDLSFDPTFISSVFKGEFLEELRPGSKMNYRVGGELALLAFARRGGKIRNTDLQKQMKAFIFLPESYRGLKEKSKTVVLLSTGIIYVMADLDVELAAYALGQIDVSVSVLKISKLHDKNGIVCQIDEVGHWYQIINGSKRRECGFSEFLISSFIEGSWQQAIDASLHPLSFNDIGIALEKTSSKTIFY